MNQDTGSESGIKSVSPRVAKRLVRAARRVYLQTDPYGSCRVAKKEILDALSYTAAAEVRVMVWLDTVCLTTI